MPDNRKAVLLDAPLLYNLAEDPSESFDIAPSNPGIVRFDDPLAQRASGLKLVAVGKSIEPPIIHRLE